MILGFFEAKWAPQKAGGGWGDRAKYRQKTQQHQVARRRCISIDMCACVPLLTLPYCM